MGWDVEPFSPDQIGFFTELDKHITACGKRWGVFAFGETLGSEMWETGLGESGFLFDSAFVILLFMHSLSTLCVAGSNNYVVTTDAGCWSAAGTTSRRYTAHGN